MPQNGAAVALPLDPPSTHASAKAPTSAQVEQHIGEVVADAAIAVCTGNWGLGEWRRA